MGYRVRAGARGRASVEPRLHGEQRVRSNAWLGLGSGLGVEAWRPQYLSLVEPGTGGGGVGKDFARVRVRVRVMARVMARVQARVPVRALVRVDRTRRTGCCVAPRRCIELHGRPTVALLPS